VVWGSASCSGMASWSFSRAGSCLCGTASLITEERRSVNSTVIRQANPYTKISAWVPLLTLVRCLHDMIGLEALLVYGHFPSSEATSTGGKLSTSSQTLYAWHDSPCPPSTPVSPVIAFSRRNCIKIPLSKFPWRKYLSFREEAIVCP
jgi:hypothetical protein